MNIAFIPARGGSKSIKYKNLSKIGDNPLIDFSVSAALKSKIFDKIVISSESKKIIKYIEKFPVEIDKRPNFLSRDDTSVIDVIINYLENIDITKYKIIYLFQPTSPFVKVSHIKSFDNIFKKFPKINSVQSITKIDHNYHYLNQRHLSKSDFVSFKFEKERLKKFNKQKKPDKYIFGNLVAVKIKSILKYKNIFQKPSYGLKINWPYNLDIDTQKDLDIANTLYINDKIILDYSI